MKILTNLKTEVKDGKVTITGDIAERVFQFPAQQVTVGFLADQNHQWARHVQISQEAVFVKRVGCGFAIPLEELITNVAIQIEPKLTFAPIAKKNVSKFTVEFVSELNPMLQWQEADKADGEWKDIPEATQPALNPTLIQKGKFYRCIGSSNSGATSTPAVQA